MEEYDSEKSPWFAVGVDRHGTPGFRVCSDEELFNPDSNISFSSDLECPFPGTRSSTLELSNNDRANLAIVNIFNECGIDIVFGTKLDEVRSFTENRLCKVILFHSSLSGQKEVVTLVRSREDLIGVLLMPQVCKIDISRFDSYQELDPAPSGVFLPINSTCVDKNLIFVQKPFLIPRLVSLVREKVISLSTV